MTLRFSGKLTIPSGKLMTAPGVGGGEAETDPFIDDVAILLHFDSDLTTNSVGDTTVSVAGSPVVNASTPKFGAGAYDYNGGLQNGLNLTSVSSSLDFGTNDFTWEMWLRTANTPGEFQIMSNAVGFQLYWNSATTFGYNASNFGTSTTFTSPVAINDDTYHHFVIQRSSNNTRIAVDGQWSGGITDNADYNISSTRIFYFAGFNVGWQGLVDDFRMTRNNARYPHGTTFTVPSTTFPDS